jgi:hypothetical protein
MYRNGWEKGGNNNHIKTHRTSSKITAQQSREKNRARYIICGETLTESYSKRDTRVSLPRLGLKL